MKKRTQTGLKETVSPSLRGGFRSLTLAYAALILIGFAVYAFRAGSNPPGFYIDESSIAYNAHLVSETGQDEHGESFPLSSAPSATIKIRLRLPALRNFLSHGPSILAARLLSAALGASCALVLGCSARV